MEQIKLNSSKHYIPILKWKRAEQRALLELDKKHKDSVVPIFELVMPTVPLYRNEKKKQIRKSPEEVKKEIIDKFYQKRLEDIPNEIMTYWKSRPFYLDFTLIFTDDIKKTTQLKIDGINKIIPACVNAGLNITTVVNLNDDRGIKEAICVQQKKFNFAICLRVTTSDFVDDNGSNKLKNLNKKIDAFLHDYSLSPKNIDLLIDIKEIKKLDVPYYKLVYSTQLINNFREWRNYIVASGAFPEDLSGCNIGENYIPRLDWQNWLDIVRHTELKRPPIYADYTIRGPIFKDALQYFSSTTSIKYTRDNNWIVLKGKVRDYGLYLANAKLLVGNSNLFYSKNYSWGDKNIDEKAKHFDKWVKDNSIKGTGRAEDWIAWGINHHVTLVVDQIANLS